VQLKLSQLRRQATELQTHHQQLVKAKKQVLQKHVAIQQEKQVRPLFFLEVPRLKWCCLPFRNGVVGRLLDRGESRGKLAGRSSSLLFKHEDY
jgi:hypothetical protein